MNYPHLRILDIKTGKVYEEIENIEYDPYTKIPVKITVLTFYRTLSVPEGAEELEELDPKNCMFLYKIPNAKDSFGKEIFEYDVLEIIRPDGSKEETYVFFDANKFKYVCDNGETLYEVLKNNTVKVIGTYATVIACIENI